MQHPGFTRSSFQHDHLLQTPDTFVRTPLPGMQDATAVVHTAPANRAAFTQYTVEMSEQSSFCTGPAQTFIYVLDGEIAFDLDGRMTTLGPDQYAYVPCAKPHGINSRTGARAAVIEKPRIDLEGHQLPPPFTGDERTASPQPLGGDESLQVRTLLPPHPAFDFAVNTITFDPGASLPMVEIHCMEHGLLMLQGQGIYRLGDRWYPVIAGDFIWMAPYCPQWFGCLGKTAARYLLYKDWNRHPLSR